MTMFTAYAVRYQVTDVARSLAFYTEHLEFERSGPANEAFAMISNGDLRLLLSGPGSSGARRMPDGRVQEPGGWTRILLAVEDINVAQEKLKAAGIKFRNDVETGPGGSQVQIEDPDGNPIEIFQPAAEASK
jgi:glyoxylase I family protein